MNFKPFWDGKILVIVSKVVKQPLVTTIIYSHLLLYSYCCFHCCNTIAILDSLIGMILVYTHIRYLSWKNDSASMLDFVQQPKIVQNWGKWRKLPNVYLSYPIRYSKLSFVYSNPSLSNNWHLLPFSKNMSSNEYKTLVRSWVSLP